MGNSSVAPSSDQFLKAVQNQDIKFLCRLSTHDQADEFAQVGDPASKRSAMHFVALQADSGHTLQLAKVLFDDFKCRLDEIDSVGMTPLHLAAQHNNASLCQFFVKHCPDSRNMAILSGGEKGLLPWQLAKIPALVTFLKGDMEMLQANLDRREAELQRALQELEHPTQVPSSSNVIIDAQVKVDEEEVRQRDENARRAFEHHLV